MPDFRSEQGNGNHVLDQVNTSTYVEIHETRSFICFSITYIVE